jgi:hypothetical protein
MTEYATEQPYRTRVPNESNAVQIALETVVRSVPSADLVWNHPEGHTAASQQSNVVRTVRPYTAKELRMIEEADRYPPDLRKQVKAFLEG